MYDSASDFDSECKLLNRWELEMGPAHRLQRVPDRKPININLPRWIHAGKGSRVITTSLTARNRCCLSSNLHYSFQQHALSISNCLETRTSIAGSSSGFPPLPKSQGTPH